MNTERRIEQAIEIGEKNKRTQELIRNWCSHARIKNMGGVGLVHRMRPDLPMGHLAMECDHAAASGFAAWDLAAAALDFHDRNCRDCPHRVPVRLPNLSSLVAERDAARAKAKLEEAARDSKRAEEFEARQSARRSLRADLDAVSATVVDALEELDRERSDGASERLLAMARLAPEHFAPPVVEYCFGLLEAREHWFEATGLLMLQDLHVDQRRLTRCAVLSLSDHGAVDAAAAIVEANVNVVDPAWIAGALPALSWLAVPPTTLFGGPPRPGVPGPLIAVYRTHPAAVEAAIGGLLSEVRNRAAMLAANAIQILAHEDPEIAGRFARPLAAKLARAERLLEPGTDSFSEDELNEAIGAIRDALTLALHRDPEGIDALLKSFLEGANREAQGRMFSVYREVLDQGRRRAEPVPAPAPRVALKRLVWAATSLDNDDVLKELQSTLAGGPDDLAAIARDELDALLGAAALVDDRLQRLNASRPPPEAGTLALLEYNGRRDGFADLAESLVEWAASGAAGDRGATAKFIELLASLPEDREVLRAVMVQQLGDLVAAPDDLAVVLPELYAALVGSSARLRAAAARVVGELGHRLIDDAPELLLEAFLALLLDPFVIVHQAAVDALERTSLPEGMKGRVANSLLTLIAVYARENERRSDEFLVDCIALYAARYASKENVRGLLGKWLLATLSKVRAEAIAKELYTLSMVLGDVEGFGALLIGMIKNKQAMSYANERILETFAELSASAVAAVKADIEKVAVALSGNPKWSAVFVEILTRAGAWTEAARVADAAHASIPDTTRMHPMKLNANLLRVAARYEKAIAAGDQQATEDLALQWQTTLSDIEEDETRNAARRDPLRGFLGPR